MDIYIPLWYNGFMKLSEWAKTNGISYKTAWRWFKDGKLPVPAEQTPTGTILVQERGEPPGKIALYARVSSADQKSDLDSQISRLLTYANEQGWEVGKAVTEIGSDLNGHRPKLMKLLADLTVRVIVVEHRDRLMRFGFEYVEAALSAQGRRVVVMDQTETKDDPGSAKNKAQKAMEAMERED